MLESFSRKYPEVNVKIITADALYGAGSFMDKSNQYFPRSQVVTQLRKNQSARLKNQQPGLPVGCMIERIKAEALVTTIK